MPLPYTYPWQQPEPRAWRVVYMYLRTRTSLDFADDALNALADDITSLVDVFFFDDDLTWDNGLVIRRQFCDDASHIANALKSSLDTFEAWAVIDDFGDFQESNNDGPLSHFFETTEFMRSEGLGFSQLYIRWDEDNPWSEEIVSRMKGQLKGYHAPVFFFEDGQIIFVKTSESGKITNQRCSSTLKGLPGWAVVDPFQETFSRKGRSEKLWERAADLRTVIE